MEVPPGPASGTSSLPPPSASTRGVHPRLPWIALTRPGPRAGWAARHATPRLCCHWGAGLCSSGCMQGGSGPLLSLQTRAGARRRTRQLESNCKSTPGRRTERGLNVSRQGGAHSCAAPGRGSLGPAGAVLASAQSHDDQPSLPSPNPASPASASPAHPPHLGSGSGGNAWNSRVCMSRRYTLRLPGEQAGPFCRQAGGETACAQQVNSHLRVAAVRTSTESEHASGLWRRRLRPPGCALLLPLLAWPPIRYRCRLPSSTAAWWVSGMSSGTVVTLVSTHFSVFRSMRHRLGSTMSFAPLYPPRLQHTGTECSALGLRLLFRAAAACNEHAASRCQAAQSHK